MPLSEYREVRAWLGAPVTAPLLQVFVDRVAGRTGLRSLGALRSLGLENAGGRSQVSEALSIEYFTAVWGATGIVCEMEIRYWSDAWKKVDFLCVLGNRVGVSVTRLMGYPDVRSVSPEQCLRLLLKKLYGLVVARTGVEGDQSYDRSILHIWCPCGRAAEMMRATIESAAFDDRFSYLFQEGCHWSREGFVCAQDILILLTVADDPELHRSMFLE